MPKKQTESKSLLPKRILIISVTVLLMTLGTAQILFNLHVQRQLNQLNIYHMRSLMTDAINDLTDLKSQPDSANRIPEVRLQLPTPTDELGKVVYIHQKAEDSVPESLQITTRSLTDLGISQLNGTTTEELFDAVPEAQACSRGFTLRFSDEEIGLPSDLTKSGAKRLDDGRIMHVWREQACGTNQPNTDKHTRFEAMNRLEQYLLSVQAY